MNKESEKFDVEYVNFDESQAAIIEQHFIAASHSAIKPTAVVNFRAHRIEDEVIFEWESGERENQ